MFDVLMFMLSDFADEVSPPAVRKQLKISTEQKNITATKYTRVQTYRN